MLSSKADSPTLASIHDTQVFAKPHEESQLFSEFLEYVIQQETDPDFPADAEVRYAQTRKPSLNEYRCLCPRPRN